MRILILDFGGSSVKYALVNENVKIVETDRMEAPLESPEQFLDTVCNIYKMTGGCADGISISIPGYINSDTGELVGSGAYYNMYGQNIVDLIHTRLDLNVAVENDGKCGALAETWKGALSDCEDGVVLILGSGVAGGVIKDKRIHSGKSMTAGEFSNYIVNPNQPNFLGKAVMNCAAFGLTYKLCKEKNIDLACQDLGHVMLDIDKEYGSSFQVFEEKPIAIRADGKQLSLWIKEGDSVAKRIYDEFLASLAFMIVNIQITFAPERIVIGGGLSRINNMILDLKEELDSYYRSTGFGPELQATVVLSKYLDECNIIGAARNYLNRFPDNSQKVG